MATLTPGARNVYATRTSMDARALRMDDPRESSKTARV